MQRDCLDLMRARLFAHIYPMTRPERAQRMAQKRLAETYARQLRWSVFTPAEIERMRHAGDSMTSGEEGGS